MPLPKRFALILSLGMLSACATREIPRIVDSSCLAFKTLSYAIPPLQADGTRSMGNDAGNAHDTPETVAEIAEHNARYEAVCPKP